MQALKKIDKAVLSLLVATVLFGLGLALWDKKVFHLSFAIEDGPIEYGTAIFLAIAAGVLALNAKSLSGQGKKRLAWLTVLYAVMYFAAAGEEISWGQRIFNWTSGEFFVENNYQGETNLHNLMVGDTHLAKLVFGHLLSICILVYLVVLPLLYGRITLITKLCDALAVPVPSNRHAVLALFATLIVSVIDANRKWELYELVFALLSLSIFLLPQNRDKIT